MRSIAVAVLALSGAACCGVPPRSPQPNATPVAAEAPLEPATSLPTAPLPAEAPLEPAASLAVAPGPSAAASAAEPLAADWSAADAGATAAPRHVTSVLLAVRGGIALPLYCFDEGRGELLRGAACLAAGPTDVRFTTPGVSGHRLLDHEICADGPASAPQRMPVYAVAGHASGDAVLLWHAGADAPPPFEPVGRQALCASCAVPPPLARDLDADGRPEAVAFESGAIVATFAGGARALLTPPGETGPYGLLALADLDRDGLLEAVVQRDLVGLWEFAVAEATRPSGFAPVARLGCGELG